MSSPSLSRAAVRGRDPSGAPPPGDTWIDLSPLPLPVAEAGAWAVLPSCGAVVTFSGTARDHSADRSGVLELDYEAYEPYATDRLHRVAEEVRRRWPDTGRVALLHRTGLVRVTESAVVVAVSSPHRDVAFVAARFAIDEVKATVPLWKQERWPGGSAWTEPCGPSDGRA